MARTEMAGIVIVFSLLVSATLFSQEQINEQTQAQDKMEEVEINASIENALGDNEGKFDQECIKTLMESAGKDGAGAELAMIRQLMRKYPGQLSLIRQVGLKNCSKAAAENCRKAVMDFSAEKKKSNETASKEGMEDKKKSGGRDELQKSTGEKNVRVQFSNSSDYKINGTENVRDTESMHDTDSDGNTASYINLSQNQRTVLIPGGTKVVEPEEMRASP